LLHQSTSPSSLRALTRMLREVVFQWNTFATNPNSWLDYPVHITTWDRTNCACCLHGSLPLKHVIPPALTRFAIACGMYIPRNLYVITEGIFCEKILPKLAQKYAPEVLTAGDNSTSSGPTDSGDKLHVRDDIEVFFLFPWNKVGTKDRIICCEKSVFVTIPKVPECKCTTECIGEYAEEDHSHSAWFESSFIEYPKLDPNSPDICGCEDCLARSKLGRPDEIKAGTPESMDVWVDSRPSNKKNITEYSAINGRARGVEKVRKILEKNHRGFKDKTKRRANSLRNEQVRKTSDERA